VDDNLAGCYFSVNLTLPSCCKWHIKQDNLDQVAENLYNYLFKLLL
jgi:hypothetical protein